MRVLQELMGHRDFKTTLIYADYAPSEREAELGRAGLPSTADRNIRQGIGPMRPPVIELTAHAVVRETVVFRIVRGASPQDPEVVEGLHFNYRRGFDPRGIEVANALVHMGISTYRARPKAVGIAQRWPRIGDHIAELRLRPEHGIWFADTGEPGHVTVWGRPLQLLDCVADILPVDRP